MLLLVLAVALNQSRNARGYITGLAKTERMQHQQLAPVIT